MTQTKQTPKELIAKMNQAFFDLSPQGTLVYMDPMIGPLHNAERQIGVAFNAETGALELHVAGCVKEIFALTTRIEDACRRAFASYFKVFEEFCRGARPCAVAA